MKEYANTDLVPATGEYLCTSFGESTEFEADDDFSVCPSCEDGQAGWTPAVEEMETAGAQDDTEEEFGE